MEAPHTDHGTVRETVKINEETIRVELGDRSYPIRVGAGLLPTLGDRLREMGAGSRVAVVTNPTIGALYADAVCRGLGTAGFAVHRVDIPDGEEHKGLTSLAHIYDQLIGAKLDRGSVLVALGGGVVGDVGGFAAATFLRGISLVQVPTTLVAQVDSSIGGKTAINHAAGKNLIGSFYQPRLVLSDVELLRTLPRRELVSGLAEVIKYGVILDAELFEFLETAMPRALAGDVDVLAHIVTVSSRLKATVVSADENEGEYRAILNFGHTLGHAIETVTGYTGYLHGEAVAIGMMFAARLSQRRGHCDPATVSRIRELVLAAGLPVDLPGQLEPRAVVAALGTDKKAREGAVTFVCIDAIGRTRFERLSADEIASFLTS
jgi:3-dehydroquinate synthase